MNEIALTRRESLMALAALAAAGRATLPADEADRYAVPQGVERVCLSLRVLESRAENALFLRARPPTEVASLAGIGWLEGYYLDPSGPGDLVLFGQRSTRPALHLDDLIVNLRNIAENDSYPRCSLDPLPENVKRLQEAAARGSFAGGASAAESLREALGPQQVVVDGVPRNSRHAHIMIEADYHMKKVSQSHIRLPGVKSYLELALMSAGSGSGSMARFWFHIAEGAPLFEESEEIVWLDDCRVALLTEKQAITKDGGLHDAQDKDPIATAFATAMSRELHRFKPPVPIYDQLVNLYRLRAILLAVRLRDGFAGARLNANDYLRRYQTYCDKPMPESMPALANYVSTRSGHVAIVCGGVGMDMNVNEQSFRQSRQGQLSNLRREALRRRPSRDALAWVFSLPT